MGRPVDLRQRLKIALSGVALLGLMVATAPISIAQTRKTPVPMPPPRAVLAPQAPLSQAPSPSSDIRSAQTAPAGGPLGQQPLNMVRTAPEQIGQVPNHFFWIRPGLQAVQDPVDGQLVFMNDEGRIVARARLPAGFVPEEVFAEAHQIRLIDGGRRQVAIPRNLDVTATVTLAETMVAANSGMRTLQLTRRGSQELLYRDNSRSGSPALEVRSVTGGTLAQAYEVGPGRGDDRYVVTEEIVSAKPAIKVRVFVQRFDRAGHLTGMVFVPLDGMDAVPRDFITVTGEGVVRQLVPTESGVKIRQFEFSAAPAKGRKFNDSDLRGLGKAGRELSVETNIGQLGNFSRFQKANEVRFKVDVPTPPISREDVIKGANAYLSINWMMAPENFMRSGIENTCVPGEAKFWRRPTRFTPETIGQTIGPMPYRWGGDDTPATFRLRLDWGALAGSICTCRDPALDYCLLSASVGIDCSGLVSRAWGIEKRGTSGLLDVSTEVDSLADVKPGDAFDWPGRHVRLFVNKAPGAATAYTVIEASTRLECEGACMRTYRPSELDGYRIIRYRGITD